MNFTYNDLGVDNGEADANRWFSVGYLWRKAIEEYRLLIEDAMTSGKPLAAIAAARFLIDLNHTQAVDELCCAIYEHGRCDSINYPKVEHRIFSQIPSQILYKIIEASNHRHFKQGEIICRRGEESNSTFFLVSGRISVEDISGRDNFTRTPEDEIFGEFGLFATMKRTATLRAIDECLVLEIHNRAFRSLLTADSSLAEDRILSIISGRIIENLRESETLFPQPRKNINSAGELEKEKFKDIDAVYDSANWLILKNGDKVALDELSVELKTQENLKQQNPRVYVVFNGKVIIHPSLNTGGMCAQDQNKPLPIIGDGETGAGQVIGVFDQSHRSIDGYIAKAVEWHTEVRQNGERRTTLVEETLLISLDRKRILDLLRKYKDLAEHWDGLYGKRIGLVNRM